MAKKESRGNGRQFETPSGIVHNAASLANLPNGIVTDYFGPPGRPEERSSIVSSGGHERPNLLTKFAQGGKGKK